MANNDWDLDDLLEFHFDREVPGKNKKIDDIDEDRKLYEELRRKSKSSNAPAFDVPEPLSNHKWIDDDDIFAQYDREHAFSRKSESAPVEEVDEHPHHNIMEIEAIKQASQEAYDRYRSNYTKNKSKKEKKSGGRKRVSGFHRVLTLIYLIAFGVFAASMIFMNVLPFGMGVALFGVLILLSLVIFIQTRRRKSKN